MGKASTLLIECSIEHTIKYDVISLNIHSIECGRTETERGIREIPKKGQQCPRPTLESPQLKRRHENYYEYSTWKLRFGRANNLISSRRQAAAAAFVERNYSDDRLNRCACNIRNIYEVHVHRKSTQNITAH